MAVDAYAGSSRCCLLLGGRDVNTFPNLGPGVLNAAKEAEYVALTLLLLLTIVLVSVLTSQPPILVLVGRLAYSAYLNNTLHNWMRRPSFAIRHIVRPR